MALACKGHETASKFRKVWGVSQDKALARVKELLSSPPGSKSPDFDREFQVHVDASKEGVVSLPSLRRLIKKLILLRTTVNASSLVDVVL